MKCLTQKCLTQKSISVSLLALLSAFTMSCGASDGASGNDSAPSTSQQNSSEANTGTARSHGSATSSGQPTSQELVGGASFVAGEITVAPGFSVEVFHEGVGQRARHLAVRDNGDVYVARIDGTLVALRDSNGDGKADQKEERKLPITTDVHVKGNWLYFSDRVSVNRLPLGEALLPAGEPEVLLSGFTPERQHAEKNFTFDGAGNIYVNFGAPANACQEKMRTPKSPGLQPCPLLDEYAGIWKFDGGVAGQTQKDGTRYVTGVRNGMAMEWSERQKGLFLAVHGRDSLSSLWPDYYTDAQSAELPGEEFHFAQEGGDLGWPYTYYDPLQGKRMLAPEYGGDGVKTPTKDYQDPIHAFPAHWAPNDLILLENDNLPAPYNEGALIAFHGSWNRAPLPQAGYRVGFLPMKNGKKSGEPINFAVGFPLKETVPGPGDAEHRPMGLAQAKDGSIFIADSVKGTIWKISKTN